jgi:hypothetical protein
VDESFQNNPFEILQAILHQNDQSGNSASHSFMLAFTLSISLNPSLALLQLIVDYETVILPHLDFDLCVLIIASLSHFSGHVAMSILTVIRKQLTKLPNSSPSFFSWVNSINADGPFSMVSSVRDVVHSSLAHVTTRLQEAKATLIHETTNQIELLNINILKQSRMFFTCLTAEIVRWKLEVANRKKMFSMILASDLSVYARVRENLDPFPRFISFSEASSPSDELREKLFKLIYNVDVSVFCTTVIVDIEGQSGICLMVQHPEHMLLVNGMMDRFVCSPNSAAFDVILATSVMRSYKFEGQLVIPFNWGSLLADDNFISAPTVCVFPITIRPFDSTCRTFLAAIERINLIQHMTTTTV